MRPSALPKLLRGGRPSGGYEVRGRDAVALLQGRDHAALDELVRQTHPLHWCGHARLVQYFGDLRGEAAAHERRQLLGVGAICGRGCAA